MKLATISFLLVTAAGLASSNREKRGITDVSYGPLHHGGVYGDGYHGNVGNSGSFLRESSGSENSVGYGGEIADGHVAFISGAGEEAHHAEHIKAITITKKVPYPVAHPYPVEVIQHVPYKVPKPVPFVVQKPYEVIVAKPYAVPVEKPVPYTVEKKVPYPVYVPHKVPYPVKVYVHKPYHAPIKVLRPVTYYKKVSIRSH
ncbi:hypothetical protein J437_LFUL015419 [Ladona fulva]|uniref:Uncharacterized protein n=1 Tax=Ladona fulva TaxID=123851 RepID=A0A8K0KM85_LADFU|nr:hypothetical protein J437_LFUL015419 [Ladona fulva]